MAYSPLNQGTRPWNEPANFEIRQAGNGWVVYHLNDYGETTPFREMMVFNDTRDLMYFVRERADKADRKFRKNERAIRRLERDRERAVRKANE